jgi:surface polysaccharide O-acyltransferase-like enzyme
MAVGLINSENNSTQRQTWWYNVVLNRVRVMVFNATFRNISANKSINQSINQSSNFQLWFNFSFVKHDAETYVGLMSNKKNDENDKTVEDV